MILWTSALSRWFYDFTLLWFQIQTTVYLSVCLQLLNYSERFSDFLHDANDHKFLKFDRTILSSFSHISLSRVSKRSKESLKREFTLFFDKPCHLILLKIVENEKLSDGFTAQAQYLTKFFFFSWVISQNALVQSDCTILLSAFTRKRVQWLSRFLTSS